MVEVLIIIYKMNPKQPRRKLVRNIEITLILRGKARDVSASIVLCVLIASVDRNCLYLIVLSLQDHQIYGTAWWFHLEKRDVVVQRTNRLIGRKIEPDV